ncbi:MAG TPA: hypothetical protein ENK41_04680 [Rhodobacteraceae bacterium]|nr:hypothetical protein [Paracoccaceae bacterium]
MGNDPGKNNADGRMAAVVIAATGMLWIAANWLGEFLDWSNRTRALFDLMALAGFAFGLIQVFRVWRARRKNDG